MFQVEPDRPYGWCVREVATGEYRARRFTRQAADAMVDAWVREHATQLIPRAPVPVETPPLVEHWEVTRLDTWALIEGRWWAHAGDPQRWVPAELVRRYWPRERTKRR